MKNMNGMMKLKLLLIKYKMNKRKDYYLLKLFIEKQKIILIR